MLNRLLGFLLFLAIVAIVALNFNQILTFSQERMIYNSVQAALDVKNWEKAVDAYRGGLRQYPDNVPIALRLGWLYEQQHQPGQAEKIYRNILDKHPDNLQARIGLINVVKTDPLRINEAVDELRKAMKTNPEDALLLGQAGNLYKTAAENPAETREHIRNWLYDQARYYYELSLQGDPEQFQTNFNLAVAYQYMNRRELAAKAYCRAIVQQPDSCEARFNLGLVLSDMNFLDEAYRQMQRSVDLLSEGNDMQTARQVAQKAQNVKNSIYNNPERRGLTSKTHPAFLDPKCLLEEAPQSERTARSI
jgi:tetratricopeptide (TPR) repeat protein